MNDEVTPDGLGLAVGIAQIAPVFLDPDQTIAKAVAAIDQAAEAGADLVVFGETLIPGYPFWLSRTDGARFESPVQKRLYAAYVDASPTIEDGDLDPIREAAARQDVSVVVGIAERASDRGRHSVFASRVFIDSDGDVLSVHRKLVPTYEERLVWAHGDGAGLRTHDVGPFTVGALNCWENWIPTARAALYGQGENLHVALWPGSRKLTEDITRFIARESRSYVVSVGNVLRGEDLPADLPERDLILEGVEDGDWLFDGGSCVASPDGQWLLEPQSEEEAVYVVELDYGTVLEGRQSFDPAGHYARPEILQLTVDRRRHSSLRVIDDIGSSFAAFNNIDFDDDGFEDNEFEVSDLDDD